jgi:hypothetical protein
VPALVIFDAALDGTFRASVPFLIQGERIALDFEAIVGAPGPAQIEYFLEFASDNPTDVNARWYRETAEEDTGGGVVNMPKVVRILRENGGALLAAGTQLLSFQFVRAHRFGRVMSRVASGTASLRIEAPLSAAVTAPLAA